jgi:hypothetical protein
VTPDGPAGRHSRQRSEDVPEVVVIEEARPVVAAPPVTVRPTIQRGVHPLWIGVALTAMVVLGALLAYLLRPQSGSEPLPVQPVPTATETVVQPIVPPPARPTVTVVVPEPAVP